MDEIDGAGRPLNIMLLVIMQFLCNYIGNETTDKKSIPRQGIHDMLYCVFKCPIVFTTYHHYTSITYHIHSCMV